MIAKRANAIADMFGDDRPFAASTKQQIMDMLYNNLLINALS